MTRSDADHPVTKIMQVAWVGFMLPVLIGIAWWKAPQFDPYTMSFFTKTYVEPTPEMPRDFRIFGGVVVGLGVLLGWSTLQGIRKKVHTLRDTVIIGLMALEIAAFGGAFFVAADAAQDRIEQEQKP